MISMRLFFVCLLLSTSLLANPLWKKTTQPAGTERARAQRNKKYKAPKQKKVKKMKKAAVRKAPAVRSKSIG